MTGWLHPSLTHAMAAGRLQPTPNKSNRVSAMCDRLDTPISYVHQLCFSFPLGMIRRTNDHATRPPTHPTSTLTLRQSYKRPCLQITAKYDIVQKKLYASYVYYGSRIIDQSSFQKICKRLYRAKTFLCILCTSTLRQSYTT